MQIAFLDDVCELEHPPSTSTHVLPKLVVYDLDDTIWFPELYMMAGAPFRKDVGSREIRDSAGVEIAVYPAARESMRLIAQTSEAFRARGTKIAVASRTHRGKWANDLMALFEFDDCPSMKDWISYIDIASGTKMRHFERLRKLSGVPYDDMLFFDNERDNCVDVAQLGVCCIHCPSGMSQDAWERGLRLFAELKRASSTVYQ
jgi:magnesium-dependent phosphatase 1